MSRAIGYCKRDHNGHVIEKFLTSPAYDPQQFLDQGFEPYDGSFDDGPYEPTPVEDVRRNDRDSSLQASDWTQLPDVPRATRERWAAYRQALRDLPEQPGWPVNVDWPEPPS